MKPSGTRAKFRLAKTRRLELQIYWLSNNCTKIQLFEGLAELKISKHPNSLSA
jgi:hypothetical protein